MRKETGHVLVYAGQTSVCIRPRNNVVAAERGHMSIPCVCICAVSKGVPREQWACCCRHFSVVRGTSHEQLIVEQCAGMRGGGKGGSRLLTRRKRLPAERANQKYTVEYICTVHGSRSIRTVSRIFFSVC